MPNEPLTSAGAAPPRSGDAARETAFIIDDDRLMGSIIARHLDRRGIAPVCFEDPRRLLAELPSAPPTYLFTDLEMPLMRGPELAGEARARGYRGTIVLVTASRDHAGLLAAVRGGVDDIVPKPLRDADLDLALEKARTRARRMLPAVEELRAVLDPLHQGAILLDEECVPVYANRRSREILGISSAREAAAILERGDLASHVMRHRGEPAGVLFIDVAKPLESPGRFLVGFEVHECAVASMRRVYLVLMHDFSEWRKLDELHSRFATYLSHRMRTPLTSARNAVMILSGKDEPLAASDKERFLDIGCRNIEKLISSFDELQKLFMVESGEINACRSLVRAGREIETILAESEKRGVIKGFKLHGRDCALFTSRARLEAYVSSAAETIADWLGEAPYLECSVVANEPLGEPGEDSAVTVVLALRGRVPESRGTLPDYVSLSELQHARALETLARSLDGASMAAAGALRLRLPAAPPFDRDQDLVHPLHLMLERSGLECSPFHLVSLRLAGAPPDPGAFVSLLESNLCSLFARDRWLISRGEKPGSYALFAVGEPRGRIEERMERLRERFARCCRERGDELYPAIRWDIKYSREPRAEADSPECPLVEAIL
jgi:FixJ family two-component response regulator